MTSPMPRIRAAEPGDATQLIRLWDLLFEEARVDGDAGWRENAQAWFATAVGEPESARLPVVDVDGAIVATAIGTLEVGPPNPHSPRGRAVRLANVVTVPEHRGTGLGTAVVLDVIAWARSRDADRVNLSATPDGLRIYEKLGFVLTKAPRMKLVLS
jgi:GNAT superfamily N-acetyltransferase